MISAFAQEQGGSADTVAIENGINAVAGLNKPSQLGSCPLKTQYINGQQVKTSSCAVQDADFKDVTILNFGPYDPSKGEEIPEPLAKEFPEVVNNKKLSKIYFTTVHRNDNMQMLGIGLVGADTSAKAAGDDSGFTTGTTFKLGAQAGTNYDITAAIHANTYTRDTGNNWYDQNNKWQTEQNFKNVTMGELMLSNARAGKLTYWDAKVGWVNVSSKEHFGFLDGTWQQHHWHHLLNKIHDGFAANYVNKDDGEKDQWGAYIGGMIGIQKQIQLGDRCQLKGSVAGGGQLSNVTGLTSFDLQQKGDFQWRRLGVTGQNQTTLHEAGRMNVTSVGIEYRGPRIESGLTVDKTTGTLAPLKYNDPNYATHKPDRTFSIHIKYFLSK